MTTRRPATKARIWTEFKRWCAARGLKALPAHPWTVAAYLRWVERRADAKSAHTALDVISHEHLLKTLRAPARHATVKRTVEMIERRAEVRTQHAALFDERDALSETAPPAKEPAQEGKPGRRVLSHQPRLKRARPGTMKS